MDKDALVFNVSVAAAVSIIAISIGFIICVAVTQMNETKRSAFENGYERQDYSPKLGTGWYKAGSKRQLTIE